MINIKRMTSDQVFESKTDLLLMDVKREIKYSVILGPNDNVSFSFNNSNTENLPGKANQVFDNFRKQQS